MQNQKHYNRLFKGEIMRSKYIFKTLVILMLLIFSVSAISTVLNSFGKVKTDFELDQSVTINGHSYNDPVVFIINGTCGNTYNKSLVIENHCEKSVNISATSNYIEGIDTYIIYNNSIVSFPVTLEPETIYNVKIVYDTIPNLKPKKYKITTDFIFS